MNDQLSATIIPFPVQTRRVEVVQTEALASSGVSTHSAAAPVRQSSELSQSSQRLATALSNLSAALADQKEATLRWKAAIEDLSAKMRSLGNIELAQKKIS